MRRNESGFEPRRHLGKRPEPGDALIFDAWVRGEQRACFAVTLADGSVQAFVNVCAHRSGPVILEQHQVLGDRGQSGREVVECEAHGALFDARTGLCVEGPCLGAGLLPVPVQCEGDELFVVDDERVDDSMYESWWAEGEDV